MLHVTIMSLTVDQRPRTRDVITCVGNVAYHNAGGNGC